MLIGYLILAVLGLMILVMALSTIIAKNKKQ